MFEHFSRSGYRAHVPCSDILWVGVVTVGVVRFMAGLIRVLHDTQPCTFVVGRSAVRDSKVGSKVIHTYNVIHDESRHHLVKSSRVFKHFARVRDRRHIPHTDGLSRLG